MKTWFGVLCRGQHKVTPCDVMHFLMVLTPYAISMVCSDCNSHINNSSFLQALLLGQVQLSNLFYFATMTLQSALRKNCATSF